MTLVDARSLRVLTVRQPWALHLVSGEKDVENRTRRTLYRGWLLVCAGRLVDASAPPDLFEESMPTGALVGAVYLSDVVRDHPSRWAMPDRWHWVITCRLAFPVAVPYRGALTLVAVRPEVLAELPRASLMEMSHDSTDRDGLVR